MWNRFCIALALSLAMVCQPLESLAQDSNPALTLWKQLKRALTAPDGVDYFNMGMKGALLPALMGEVVELKPETNPTTIVLAMEDSATPDVTLRFDKPLKGKVAARTKLTFEGVGDSFTPKPFMVVFDVDAAHLHGWPRSH